MNQALIEQRQEKQAKERLAADIKYMVDHYLTENCEECIHRAAGACEYDLERGCKDFYRKAG